MEASCGEFAGDNVIRVSLRNNSTPDAGHGWLLLPRKIVAQHVCETDCLHVILLKKPAGTVSHHLLYLIPFKLNSFPY